MSVGLIAHNTDDGFMNLMTSIIIRRRRFGRDNGHISSFVVGTVKLPADDASIRVPPGPFDPLSFDSHLELLAPQEPDHCQV